MVCGGGLGLALMWGVEVSGQVFVGESLALKNENAARFVSRPVRKPTRLIDSFGDCADSVALVGYCKGGLGGSLDAAPGTRSVSESNPRLSAAHYPCAVLNPRLLVTNYWPPINTDKTGFRTKSDMRVVQPIRGHYTSNQCSALTTQQRGADEPIDFFPGELS